MDNEQNNVPYQGTYTGAQIDDAIERARSPHVDKFNGRTGVVTPQAGDYSADKITLAPPDGMESTNVQGAVEELFTSVSEGKTLIASAVTDMGVPTEADATFQQIQENILAIETGGGLPENMYSVQVSADPPEGGTVSGGGVASAGMTVTVKAEQASGYFFDAWENEGGIVSKTPYYSFLISKNEPLTASFRAKHLPDEYTEVEYIQSSRTQWIDTGVIPNKNTKVVIDGQVLSKPSSGNNCLFGVQSSANSLSGQEFVLIVMREGAVPFRAYALQSKFTAISRSSPLSRYTFSLSTSQVSIGDVVEPPDTPVEITKEGNYSIALFARKTSATGAADFSNFRIFSCQIYNGEEKIRDFVPCKNSDGLGGLFDIVQNKFYGNLGTGVFPLGPAV